MHRLGTIAILQVQRNPMKTGERPNRVYNPAPLLQVPRLELTPDGLYGITENGEKIIDAHHLNHPQSRNRDNRNGVSINFLFNYAHMRQQFGPHMVDGCAAENILIQAEESFDPLDLGSKLIIKTQTGQSIYLEDMMAAPPCAEFSSFAADRPIQGEEMRATLQFLSEGMRGFYLTLTANQGAPIIQIGDQVFTPD